MKKMQSATRLAFVMLVGVIVLGALVAPSTGWLSGYNYRQMHNITGSASWTTNQTNYQVMFVVYNTSGVSFNSTAYTNGHSQGSWNDLRFTNLSDGVYDYWIESTNATSATVWVEIPEIANSTSINTSLYMYYGNPTASLYSNGTYTMVFFDDFSGSALDASKWTSSTSSGSLSVSGGILTINGGAVAAAGINGIRSVNTYALGTNIFEFRDKRTAASNNWKWKTTGLSSGALSLLYIGVSGEMSLYNNEAPAAFSSCGLSSAQSTAISDTTSWNIESFYCNGYAKFYRDRLLLATHSTYFPTGNLNIQAGAGNNAGAGAVQIDWILVRKNTPTAPLNLWWGDEELAFVFIQWDKASYASGESAILNTSFPDMFWDTVNYTYYCGVYRYPDLTTPVSSYVINQQNYDKTIDTTALGVGTYYGMLYLTDIGTSTTYFVDYDYMSVVNGITLSGITYNATSGAVLPSTSVDVVQGGVTTTYTSDAVTGSYTTTSPINVGQPITVTGYKTWYNTSTQTFTPTGAANITYDIPLVPNTTSGYWSFASNGSSFGGLVTQSPYYAPASGAYVNMSNATWYSNTTLGTTGWYQFDGLDNNTAYSLTGVKTEYSPYSNTVTAGNDTFVRLDFVLGGDFTLTTYVRDVAGALIAGNVSVSISNSTGDVDDDITTTGYTIFDHLNGEYTVTASCTGYTSNSQIVNVDSDKSVTITLLAASAASAIYYTPHNVEMVIQDNWGNGIPDTTVSITPTSTTLGDWEWLQELLGVPSTPDLSAETMYDTTDTNGALTFVMVQEIKYKVDIVNAAEGVNETIYLYPKDDQYVIVVDTTDSFVPPTDMTGTISYNLTNVTVNSTYTNLTLTYYDSSGGTTNLSFWVKSHASPVTTTYQTYCADPNNCNVGYVCPCSNGEDYYWGFNATTGFGDVSGSKGITFQKLVDLGINAAYYPWIAAAFLVVIAAIFSVLSVKFGAVLVPMFAFMFLYMKWLPLTSGGIMLLTILLVIGIFAYIRKQEDKVGG